MKKVVFSLIHLVSTTFTSLTHFKGFSYLFFGLNKQLKSYAWSASLNLCHKSSSRQIVTDFTSLLFIGHPKSGNTDLDCGHWCLNNVLLFPVVFWNIAAKGVLQANFALNLFQCLQGRVSRKRLFLKFFTEKIDNVYLIAVKYFIILMIKFYEFFHC